LATKVLTQFKQKLAGMELQPSKGGCFELTVDGELIYSKLSSGQFPDEDQMVQEIARRLGVKVEETVF
jgi:selenoprotein W-related protein